MSHSDSLAEPHLAFRHLAQAPGGRDGRVEPALPHAAGPELLLQVHDCGVLRQHDRTLDTDGGLEIPLEPPRFPRIPLSAPVAPSPADVISATLSRLISSAFSATINFMTAASSVLAALVPAEAPTSGSAEAPTSGSVPALVTVLVFISAAPTVAPSSLLATAQALVPV